MTRSEDISDFLRDVLQQERAGLDAMKSLMRLQDLSISQMPPEERDRYIAAVAFNRGRLAALEQHLTDVLIEVYGEIPEEI